ncbi:MAG TPA: arginine deiminase family protein [Terriglobales bacterium]|nr:arginine deiminase family protein [Terriglobales bacterium]
MTTSFKTEKYNGHSMVGVLRKVMVCSPQAAGWNVAERVAQSAKLGFPHPPDFDLAMAQHRKLREILEDAAVEVLDLPESPDFTLDSAYAHDSSLPTDYGLILMNPGKPNRVPEAARQREFCDSLGISVLGEIRPPGTSEAGDMVWIDPRTLLIGHGYRTNPAGIAQVRDLLKPHAVEVLTAPLPYGPGPSACLHLMSLISLLDEKTALVDLPWLAVGTVELLTSRGYTFIEIDPSERDTLACNVLSLGNKRLVAIEENHKTNKRLREAGFDVHTFPGSEICINGAGGPTCLTRPLLRADQ